MKSVIGQISSQIAYKANTELKSRASLQIRTQTRSQIKNQFCSNVETPIWSCARMQILRKVWSEK
jgi:hypothetical protein